MNKRALVVMTLGLGTITGALAMVAWPAFAGSGQAESWTGPTWEYHCVLPPGATPGPEDKSAKRTPHEMSHSTTGHHPNEKILNHLGTRGWELVAIDPNNGHYCFKRPVR